MMWIMFEGLQPYASPSNLDPLRQGQVSRVVKGVGLAAHVHLPSFPAGFAAAAVFFLASEGTANLCTAGADVYVGNAAVAAFVAEEFFCFQKIAGKEGRG